MSFTKNQISQSSLSDVEIFEDELINVLLKICEFFQVNL